MKQSIKSNIRKRKIQRPLWKKLAIGLLVPLLALGLWYSVSLANYYLQAHLTERFPQHVQEIYFILFALLYSGLVLVLSFSLWLWWKVIFDEKFTWWKPASLLVVWLPVFPVFYLVKQEARQIIPKSPQVISHRALNGPSAVENSLEAFQISSKSKFDYIEIDIWETADLEYVVFHDPNLSGWTGLHYRPHDLPLSTLTNISLTDQEGHTAHVASFDQILTEAEKSGQKLLIDFKTSELDSPQIVENFLGKYQQRLEQGQHQLQTADQEFMKRVLSHSPKFETVLIMNSILEEQFPGLTGFSVPLSDLSPELHDYIKASKKFLYVWTVNDEAGVTQADDLAVDGIISDFPGKTKDQLNHTLVYSKYKDYYHKQLENLLIFPSLK